MVVEIKEYDIVKVENDNNRLWVAHNVTQQDIEKGVNAINPGIHLFGGIWYGDKNPFKMSSFGKMIPLPENYEILGCLYF